MGWIKMLCNRLETSCSSLRKIIQREGEWIVDSRMNGTVSTQTEQKCCSSS